MKRPPVYSEHQLFSVKTIQLLMLAVMLIGIESCTKELTEKTAIESTEGITSFQKYMLDEINFARVNPSGYAESRLKVNRDSSSDNGSYGYLKNLTPVGSVGFNTSLNLSASDYAVLLAEKALAEHNADETPLRRAIRAGFEGTSTGENIAIASASSFNAILNPRSAAIDFVRILIIDDGVSGFGHRLILLSSKYKTVGIGFTQNNTIPLLNYVVQDFGNL
jgi:uncharacterized protein YkwD